ncbi:MAG: TetR/AcrR family transcriptional regulator [Acidimicrobiia bacterium]|nr:TetR/AcrR family transcriptional regulator [Acidimicrobiia bacterium]
MAPAERRAQLLDAAVTVIRRDGPDVSMDAIAAEAGVTKPVLYSHFGGRAGLASAMADIAGEFLAAEVAVALDPSSPPYVQLHGAIDIFVRWVRDEQELFLFFVSARTEEEGRPSVLRIADSVAEAVTPPLRLYYEVMGRPTDDVELHAHGIAGFVYAGVEHSLNSGTLGEDGVDVVTSLTDFMWTAISGGSAPPR